MLPHAKNRVGVRHDFPGKQRGGAPSNPKSSQLPDGQLAVATNCTAAPQLSQQGNATCDRSLVVLTASLESVDLAGNESDGIIISVGSSAAYVTPITGWRDDHPDNIQAVKRIDSNRLTNRGSDFCAAGCIACCLRTYD